MSLNRRRFLSGLGLAGLGNMFFEIPGLFAEELVRTPSQTEGPYYPTSLPLDTDNDLLVINNAITPAVGTVTYVSGRILDLNGEPVRNATVEIWHADNSGAYVHPSSQGYQTRDLNFQGFGRFVTGSTGEYLFRTIKPGLYTGRTRHFHFKVKVSGMPDLTTQLYFLGEPGNASDGIWNGIQNVRQRNSVTVPFVAVSDSTVGAQAARFDIVLGNTAAPVPMLVVTNTTDPARNSTFGPGENWRLDLSNASPASRVYLHIWKDNQDLGISGPHGNLTGVNGTWSLSSSFGSADSGSWQMQAIVGTSASAETSVPIALRIVV